MSFLTVNDNNLLFHPQGIAQSETISGFS